MHKFYFQRDKNNIFCYIRLTFSANVRSKTEALSALFQNLSMFFKKRLNITYFVFIQGAYTARFVPFSILGVLSLTSAILILLLPETHNKSLMDTIQHGRRDEVAETKFEEDEGFHVQNAEEKRAFVSTES